MRLAAKPLAGHSPRAAMASTFGELFGKYLDEASEDEYVSAAPGVDWDPED